MTLVHTAFAARLAALRGAPSSGGPGGPVLAPPDARAERTPAREQLPVAGFSSDTLPLLTGVRVEIEGEKITLLATDRYRLAQRELPWTPGPPRSSTPRRPRRARPRRPRGPGGPARRGR